MGTYILQIHCIETGLIALMHSLHPYCFEILKLFAFFAFLFTRQTFAYFRCCMYDFLNEGALLRSLKNRHCPCFEKQFQ